MDKDFLIDILSSKYENELIEFKENWFNKDELGEYISALSNSAAEFNAECGYIIWGINNDNHAIVGTIFDPNMEIKNEPLKHYLARCISPSINFKFEDFSFKEGKVVVLTIPAAKRVITEFNKERFIRIGSSKELLRKYPDKEADLWITLRKGMPTIINSESSVQNLSFSELMVYYISKGLPLNKDSLADNLGFYVPNTHKFNKLAYILSNENDLTCRVSIFSGKKKSDNQYSLNDFGRKSILLTIDQILNYLESFNIVRVDETNRMVERKETPLFDSKSLREAVLNAFIHNDWVDLNSPMISVFTDRIEILSYGSLPNRQTLSGFFAGKSKPRCNELSEIFLQLRISERSGRGVSRIVDTYGKEAFEISDDFIRVTIPFSEERYLGFNISEQKHEQKDEQKLQSSKERTKTLILSEMRHNSNVTTMQLIKTVGLKKTSVQKYIKELTEEGKIERIGPKNGGCWKVTDKQ